MNAPFKNSYIILVNANFQILFRFEIPLLLSTNVNLFEMILRYTVVNQIEDVLDWVLPILSGLILLLSKTN